jgi:hypothetical protein
VCKDGTCCTPTTCAAQNQTCGTLPDNCGTTLTCTGCTGCCSGESCVTVCPAGKSCSGGVCTDPVVTYECPGPLLAFLGAGQPATTRFAQTFTAAQSGSLLQIQLQVVKNADSTGDYVVDLLAASGGGPTNTVLATATISNASVPVGASTLTASFSGPPLVAGTRYAAAISRPGGNQLGPGNRPGSPCPGSAFSQTPTGTGAFEEFTVQGGIDLIATVTVLP